MSFRWPWVRAWALFAIVFALFALACAGGDDASEAPGDDGGADTSIAPPPTNQVDGSLPDGAKPPPITDAHADTSAHDANPPNYAPPPVLTAIAPNQAIVGATGPTIVCTGTGFVARSVVQVDGVALVTSFASDTELRATMPDGKLAQTGTVHVTVGTAPPGGGGSAEVDFQVMNPEPVLTALAPISVPVGSTATPLTVTGSGFQSGSTIAFAGTTLATTFVSATSLTTTIPTTSLATAGTYPITITNPAPGGGTSKPISFIVSNPNVTIVSVTPNVITFASPATPIAIVGTGFVAASAASFNGTPIATTYTDGAHLSATIPASALLTAGSFPVAVTNPAPGGGVSAPVIVHVQYPVPVATSIAPPSMIVGGTPPTITVTGSGFIAGVSTIAFNGAPVQTTVSDASHASATITTQLASVAGTIAVTVTNPAPGGGTSAAVSFTVDNPAPVATGVSPSSAIVGAGDTPITVTGSGFVASSSVLVNGAPIATSFVDGQTLTASIPSASLTNATTLAIAVQTPGPGGGTSSPVSFVVDNPGPTITSITPSSTVVPSASTPITVNGSGFVAGVSTIAINGGAVATTASNGALLATIPSSSLQAAGTLSITVVNPAPGGGTSNAMFFTANDPTPVLSSVSPSTITHGSGNTPITLTGSGFVAASVVKANGTTIASAFVDGGDMTATVPASMLLGGNVTITVTNAAPGGGTSAGKTISVVCDVTGADVVLSSLKAPQTFTMNLASSSTKAERITVSGSNYKCPSSADTSTTDDPGGTEPYVEYLVVNDTSSQVTLDAWADCSSNASTSVSQDAFLAFYATSTKPSTQSALEQCATYVSEGKDGAGALASPSSGSAIYCPGLTKANGGGLTLAACAKAVVIAQPYSITNTTYPPPPTLVVQIE